MTATEDRVAEGLGALTEVIRLYGDVFGPACWCEDDECEGDCGTPAPPTVGLTAWVVVVEHADLDPDGNTHTRWRCGPGTSPNLALGMLSRVTRRL